MRGMPFTFKVHDVSADQRMLEYDRSALTSVRDQLNRFSKIPLEKVEAVSEGTCIRGITTLAGAVGVAYNHHLPLSISPDHVWLAICHGLSTHIDRNPEWMRKHFVSHEGKKRIDIRRDDFVLGSDKNDWHGCFEDFSVKIKESVGKRHDLLVSKFSTTSPVERAASEIMLMAAMKHYFDYHMHTMCGFPSITVEGEASDWADILVRVNMLSEFGLTGWTNHLAPAIVQLMKSCQGNPDMDFWNNCYKEGGGSGGPHISGWINTLYPYLINYKGETFVNERLDWRAASGGWGNGNHSSHFPASVGVAPVLWHYYAAEYPLEFRAGIMGASFENDVLRPLVGWAVIHTEAK